MPGCVAVTTLKSNAANRYSHVPEAWCRRCAAAYMLTISFVAIVNLKILRSNREGKAPFLKRSTTISARHCTYYMYTTVVREEVRQN